MAETSTNVAKKKNNANVISLFMAGAKKGFYLCAEIVTPALILAYVCTCQQKLDTKLKKSGIKNESMYKIHQLF